MASNTITFDGFLQKLKLTEADIKQAVKKAAIETAEFGQAKAISDTSTKKRRGGRGVGAVDRGLFKNSWDNKIFPDRAEIINQAPYASVIELGSRPHWAPLGVLVAWVKRKRAILGIDESEVYRVAKAIQKKIAKEGTKPLFIIKDMLPLLKKFLNEAVKKELSKVK